MAAYKWVHTTATSSLPETAVQGGNDIDGSRIYIGRAYHAGDLIPAKVIPSKQMAYVAWKGAEHRITHFEVLCEQQFRWVPSSEGQVPPGAVEGGHTSDGEQLYIGRVHHKGSHTVGKVSVCNVSLVIPAWSFQWYPLL